MLTQLLDVDFWPNFDVECRQNAYKSCDIHFVRTPRKNGAVCVYALMIALLDKSNALFIGDPHLSSYYGIP